MSRVDRKERTRRIHRRVRKTVRGSAGRLRLAVSRTLSHIYVQAIDDDLGVTIAQASTVEKDIRKSGPGSGGNIEAAKGVGARIAERLKALGREDVVFDRGGFLYHGRVKALAEAAREGGLRF